MINIARNWSSEMIAIIFACHPCHTIPLYERTFNVNEYGGNIDAETFQELISPPRRITSYLTSEDHRILVSMFVEAKKSLHCDNTQAGIMKAICDINVLINTTFTKINLIDRMCSISSSLHYKDDFTIGKIDIHVLILVSKLLSPIFGQIMYKIRHSPDVNQDNIYLMTSWITNALTTERFPHTISKIRSILFNRNEMLNYDDHDEAVTLLNSQIAKLITLDFVMHDLRRPYILSRSIPD